MSIFAKQAMDFKLIMMTIDSKLDKLLDKMKVAQQIYEKYDINFGLLEEMNR